jgi:hypothetical protein
MAVFMKGPTATFWYGLLQEIRLHPITPYTWIGLISGDPGLEIMLMKRNDGNKKNRWQ